MRKFLYFKVKKLDGKFTHDFSQVVTRSLKETIKRLGFDYTSKHTDKYGNESYNGLGLRTGYELILLYNDPV